MMDEQLQRLVERWKQVFGLHQALKAAIEPAIARWEWTTRERYSPLPFHFARYPGRGRVLNEEPDTPGYFVQYGWDAQGQVRMQRSIHITRDDPSHPFKRWLPHPALAKTVYSETFTQYSGSQIEIIEFSDPRQKPIPLGIQLIDLENGRVQFCGRFRLNGFTPRYIQKANKPAELYEWLGYNGRFKEGEAYHYDGKRLAAIDGYYEAPGLAPYTARETFTYAESGKLLRIERTDTGGQKQLVYQKRPKGQTFPDLRKAATQKLVAAIIQRVKAAAVREKVYCIELSYQRVSASFPPALIVTPERYRLKMTQSGDPGDRFCIFSPIFEPAWFLTLEDPETLELCQMLEHEIQAGERWDTATDILRDVAAILTRYDWSAILEVTPDFVVFALDPEMEGDQIEAVLSRSVPPSQIREWKERGWL
jgi:hypothetical protein